MKESVSSEIPTKEDINFNYSEWVMLSKTQKKRRIAKAKGKEINKGIKTIGYLEGY